MPGGGNQGEENAFSRLRGWATAEETMPRPHTLSCSETHSTRPCRTPRCRDSAGSAWNTSSCTAASALSNSTQHPATTPVSSLEPTYVVGCPIASLTQQTSHVQAGFTLEKMLGQTQCPASDFGIRAPTSLKSCSTINIALGSSSSAGEGPAARPRTSRAPQKELPRRHPRRRRFLS